MKRIRLSGFFICCILSLPAGVSAQRQATHWVFGGLGAVDFSCSAPQLDISAFDALEGGASISDENGNLLLYTDGNTVWNREHQIMPNGRGIGGACTNFGNYGSASQSALIIPHPGNSSLFYIFTADCAEDNFQDGIRYSMVDISLADGLGDVIEKEHLLIAPAAEKLAAVFHENEKDVWVVTHGINDNNFYSFLVTEEGLHDTPVISSVGQVHQGGRGYLKFSPDGKRIASGSFVGLWNDGNNLEVFTFDDNTGIIASEFILPGLVKSIYSVSFSPNGRMLYVSCSWVCSGRIEQLDLDAGTPEEIVSSRYTFDTDNIYPAGGLQLAIDGKLYFLGYDDANGTFLGVIQRPDLPGFGSSYDGKYMKLPFCYPHISWGLPNFIESYFQEPVVSQTNCTTRHPDFIENVTFEAEPLDGCTFEFTNTTFLRKMETVFGQFDLNWIWRFGDGTSMKGSAPPEKVHHRYAQAGTYLVHLSATNECRSYWHQMEIIVEEIGPTFQYEASCEDLSVKFSNTTEGTPLDATWGWDFGEPGSPAVSSFETEHTFKEPGTYVVTLQAESTGTCTSKKSEPVIVYEPIQFSLGEDVHICDASTFSLQGPDLTDVQYQWNTGTMTKDLTIENSGEYVLEVSRGNCSASDTIQIVVESGLDPDFVYQLSCEGMDVNVENTTPGADPDMTWTWDFGEEGGQLVAPLKATYLYHAPGEYVVTLHADDFCHSHAEQKIRIYEPVSLSLGEDRFICAEDTISLEAPYFSAAQYEWNTGDTSRILRVRDAGEYNLRISRGVCSATDEIRVIGDDDCHHCITLVPNVFTPNDSDEINNHFTISSDCEIISFYLQVFNRWGKSLYNTTDVRGWNGVIGSEKVSSGVYFFQLQYSFPGLNGKPITYNRKGWVQLIR